MLKNLLFGFSFLLLSFGCQTSKNNNHITLTGSIAPQGITSYQYGTHTLRTEDTFYALKSDTVDLDEYLNEEVSITAEEIEGYPVDGGPKFLLVLKVN